MSFTIAPACAPDAVDGPAPLLARSAQAEEPTGFNLLDTRYWGGRSGDAGHISTGGSAVGDAAALDAHTYVTVWPTLYSHDVCVWKLSGDDLIEPGGCASHPMYNAGRISVARIDDERFLVAAYNDSTRADPEDGEGRLRLTAWQVASDTPVLLDARDESMVHDVDVESMNLTPGTQRDAQGAFLPVDFVVGIKLHGNGKLKLIDYLLESSGNIRRRNSVASSLSFVPGTLHLARVPGAVRTIASVAYASSGAPVTAGTPRVLDTWDVGDGGSMARTGELLQSGEPYEQLAGVGSRRIATVDQNEPVRDGGFRKSAQTVQTFALDGAGKPSQATHNTVVLVAPLGVSFYTPTIAAGSDDVFFISYGTSQMGRVLSTFDPPYYLSNIAEAPLTVGDLPESPGAVAAIAVLGRDVPVVVWQANHPGNVHPHFHLASAALRVNEIDE